MNRTKNRITSEFLTKKSLIALIVLVGFTNKINGQPVQLSSVGFNGYNSTIESQQSLPISFDQQSSHVNKLELIKQEILDDNRTSVNNLNDRQGRVHAYQRQRMYGGQEDQEERDRLNNQKQDGGIYSSRSFAIGLIGIASLYLIVMICKAYRRMQDDDMYSYDDESISYYYDTESYDFGQYQSQNESFDARKNERGFNYNESIDVQSKLSKEERNRFNDINKIAIISQCSGDSAAHGYAGVFENEPENQKNGKQVITQGDRPYYDLNNTGQQQQQLEIPGNQSEASRGNKKKLHVKIRQKKTQTHSDIDQNQDKNLVRRQQQLINAKKRAKGDKEGNKKQSQNLLKRMFAPKSSQSQGSRKRSRQNKDKQQQVINDQTNNALTQENLEFINNRQFNPILGSPLNIDQVQFTPIIHKNTSTPQRESEVNKPANTNQQIINQQQDDQINEQYNNIMGNKSIQIKESLLSKDGETNSQGKQ